MSDGAERNLVMKGGVTSGLVYAGALPVLAGRFRFRAIAGSSAGAIAAAFAAAAEYARSRGDEQAFARLQAKGAELPKRLVGLFQASPPFRRLLRALIMLAPGSGRARWAGAVLCFWPEIVMGALAGAALCALAAALSAPPAVLRLAIPAVLGAFGGSVAALTFRLTWLLAVEAPRRNFGLCSGLSQDGSPGLTDWLHDALQTIAFGARGRAVPLNFGDLFEAGVDLRLLATNLSHARPEVTPELAAGLSFRPTVWAGLFPASVMTVLAPGGGDVQALPPAPDLPILVAVRMSLACPGLMEAVPALDAAGRRIWYADGGLTTNFPFELLDSDARPTLALDIDTLHAAEADASRVRALAPDTADAPAELGGVRAFVWSLLVALREGRLRAAARTPGRRARIYQVRLTADEGGMNLAMSEAEAQRLIDYGQALGAYVVAAEGEGGA